MFSSRFPAATHSSGIVVLAVLGLLGFTVFVNSLRADSIVPEGGFARPGANAQLPLPLSIRYRSGAARMKAMAFFKMKPKSELAVLRGLEWLRQRQNGDGSWGEKNNGGMTGFALLCLLGHGETDQSPQYGVTVARAVQWILDRGTQFDGRLNMEATITQPGAYEHGICAFALGEYFLMTKDERVIEVFKRAITHIVLGQGPGGGWNYHFDKTRNDLSVSSWQIQALRTARASGLGIPGVDDALKRVGKFVAMIQGAKGGYGYTGPEDRYSLTGAGIALRLWGGSARSEVTKGMDWMLAETEKNQPMPLRYKGDNADLYAWYFHTSATLWYGGRAWQKWHRWFQDEITDAQNPDGSWPAPGGKMQGPANEETLTGQTYRTTLCILMLESFYRFVPAVGD